jgi:hypothetical protein
VIFGSGASVAQWRKFAVLGKLLLFFLMKEKLLLKLPTMRHYATVFYPIFSNKYATKK